ncbi:hypothetical protein LA59_24655 [Vibrio harveyi]|uniref:hypothetical protein n=1 Tax=Vibrio harveyi TaxID=669 RepID=UPI00053955B0|nr:hypothetical protein [Vibrio harveyi]AIV08584.1 hypothetical protein LA59_24655 [Vibrio harveyi]
MNEEIYGCNIIELMCGPDEYEKVLRKTDEIRGVALDYALAMAIYNDKYVFVNFAVGGRLESVIVGENIDALHSSPWSPTRNVELAQEVISKFHPAQVTDLNIITEALTKLLQEVVLNRVGTEVLIPKMKWR